MADALHEIANIDNTKGEDMEISLSEIEKSFDDITKDEKKDDAKQVEQLVKAFEKNLLKPKYMFDYEKIKKQIIEENMDISDMPESKIKVYQLCKRLESVSGKVAILPEDVKKKQKKIIIKQNREYLNLNGKIWTDLISDKILSYDDIWLLEGNEELTYDANINMLSLKTKFGTYEQIVAAPYSVVNNEQNLKNFINQKREEHFAWFLEKNKITTSDSEFRKSLTEKYPNASEEISLMHTQMDEKIIYVDFKNDAINYIDEQDNDAILDKSFSYEIKPETTEEQLFEFIQNSRDRYKKQVEKRKEYQEFLVEADRVNEGSYIDAYNNISLLLGEEEYKKFKSAKFSLHDISKESIALLQINDEGKLVIDDKEILPWYGFGWLTIDKQLLLVVNISKILQEFITYYPDNTQRQNFWTLDSVKHNVVFEKAVLTQYMQLIQPENIEKFKNGTLNLNGVNPLYRERAFSYFIGAIKEKGETAEMMISKRTTDSPMLKFVEKKRDSSDADDQRYVKLYYTFIQEKLWTLLKVENTVDKKTKKESVNRLLDPNQITMKFNEGYQRLICQKWMDGSELTQTEMDQKMIALAAKNNRLSSLTSIQKSVLLKTEMGKWLLKSAIYNLEGKKYEEVNKTFTTYEQWYNKQLENAYNEIQYAKYILNDTRYNLGKPSKDYYSSTADPIYKYQNANTGEMEFDRAMIPSKYRKYIIFNKDKLPNPWREFDDGVAESKIFALRKPFEEKWVSHMKNIHSYGLTQYIEWVPPGKIEKVNVAYAIENGKKFQSPFSDQYCQSKIDFSMDASEDVVRDTNRESFRDWTYEKQDAIEKDPLNGIASVVVDVSWVVVWGIVAGVVTLWTKSPQLWALAFTATDNIVKAQGYGILEGVNYLTGNGDMGDYDNIWEAMGYGSAKGLGILETETNQYEEVSYVKDINGDLVFKDWDIILAEKSLEVWSSLILFGPVGKVWWMVTKEVFNSMIIQSCVKSYGKEITYKIFGKEISNLGAKMVANTIWFFAEVSTFTAFNTLYAPFSAGVIELVSSGDRNAAMTAAESAWEQSTSIVGLTTSFIHNVGFIGLLKWSNLLSEPLSSKIMTKVEKTKYSEMKIKGEALGNELSIEMGKAGVEYLTPEKIIEYKKWGRVVVDTYNEGKEWWFFKKTETGYEYVPGEKIPKIYEINNKITKLNAQVALLMQSLSIKADEIKRVEEIKNFNEFIAKNNLAGKDVTPEIILEKRIEYCEAKIKETEWTEKAKYEEILKTLKIKKEDLIVLRLWYDKALKSIEIDAKGNIIMNGEKLPTKTENIKNDDMTGNEIIKNDVASNDATDDIKSSIEEWTTYEVIKDRDGFVEKIQGEWLVKEIDGKFLLTDMCKELATKEWALGFVIKEWTSEYMVSRNFWWESNEWYISNKIVLDVNGKVKKIVWGKNMLELYSNNRAEVIEQYAIDYSGVKIEVEGFEYDLPVPFSTKSIESPWVKYNEQWEITTIKWDGLVKEYTMTDKLQEFVAKERVSNEIRVVEWEREYVIAKDKTTNNRWIEYVDYGTSPDNRGLNTGKEIVWINEVTEKTPIWFVEVTEFSSAPREKWMIEYKVDKHQNVLVNTGKIISQKSFKIVYDKFLQNIGEKHSFYTIHIAWRELLNNGIGNWINSSSQTSDTKTVEKIKEGQISEKVKGTYDDIIAQLEDGPRLLKAEELLWIKLTPEQQQAILTAHNQEGTLYNFNFTQIKARADILSKAGFTSEQIRVLLENGICGQAETGVVENIHNAGLDGKDIYPKLTESKRNTTVMENKEKIEWLWIKINEGNMNKLASIKSSDWDRIIKNKEGIESNALKDVDIQTGGNKREILKDQIAKWKKIENSGDITIPKWKIEAPVEKKLSPEVEKLYIETIDRIDDITQQIIDGKLPGRDGTENMLLEIITHRINTKYSYLIKQLSYVDQAILNDNLSKFAKEFTILNKANNKIKTSNDWLEKFKITGLSLDFAVDNYGKIIDKKSGSILQKEDFYIEWENPSNLTVWLTNKAADIFLGEWVAWGMNKIGKFNDERFNIEYVRVERNPAWEYKPIEIWTVIHERQHSIYDAFFSQSDIKEIASKYRKLKDKTKRELSESIKSIKEENINSFVNETLKSWNESVMELSVDEILAYKKDWTEAVNIFENLTETNDYNYTLELNDFLKSEFLARNIDISETINKFTHKKIEIIAELVNLSQHASIEELSMTPYKERHKFDKTWNTKKSDLEF